MKTPHEFKVMRLRECAVDSPIIDTPQSAYQYWKANIIGADWYDPAKEAFVALVLNTRRRIMGHNLVCLGTLDQCQVHPREVFRPVIVAAGSSIILMHNLCAAAHKLCYVAHGVMCSRKERCCAN
ncbi:MAG: JAB domain-containing protein [Limisphaerales bacterium]